MKNEPTPTDWRLAGGPTCWIIVLGSFFAAYKIVHRIDLPFEGILLEITGTLLAVLISAALLSAYQLLLGFFSQRDQK